MRKRSAKATHKKRLGWEQTARGRQTQIIPPEGVPIDFKIASLGARFGAQITDILLTVLSLAVFFFVLIYLNLFSGEALVALGALLFFAIRVPYYVITELIWNGQTLGKRLLKIRVISANGRTLSPHAITVRNLMKEMEVFVPGTMLLVAENLDPVSGIVLVIWICILLIVPLTNKRRQRLGDIIANTMVVDIPRPLLLPDLARKDGATQTTFAFQPHHLDHYGRFELQTLEQILQVDLVKLNTAAKKQHRENLQRVAETISNRIGYDETIAPDQAQDFLTSFYRTQRGYLENRRLFGDAREDKFHKKDP